MFKDYLDVLLFSVLMLYALYLSISDILYHEYSLKRIFMMYPIFLIVSLIVNPTVVEAAFSFLSFLMILYLNELLSDSRMLGGVDLAIAPLFSIWFGIGSLVLVLVYLALYIICRVGKEKNPFNRLFRKFAKVEFEEGKCGTPQIPLMLIACIICLFTISNPIIDGLTSIF